MPKSEKDKWVVYISTFPPRECGIATYTQDVMDAFDDMFNPREKAKVVAMNVDSTAHYLYDAKRVIHQINQDDESSYVDAAKFLNSLEQVTLVHVEHEYGIYGGRYGSHIVVFLRELKKPAIVTLHTVLPNPNPELKEVTCSINNHVQRILVMTETSKNILVRDYGIDVEKIAIIPHGIHSVNFSDGSKNRHDLGFQNCVVASTFGLLSPGKGIEYGIEAMKKVSEECPNAIYLIIGATHPSILRKEGEAYRNSLIKRVGELKLEGRVFFYDKYLSLPELLHFLDATNIYVSLSQDPNQAVSGTLSYALGMGRPVISTAFAQAKEDVDKDVGILVDFKDIDGIAQAIINLCKHPELRTEMEKKAYFKTRARTWRNVIVSHMSEYIRLVPALGEVERNLPPITLSHIARLTDDFGIIQFAKLLDPDPASGYTIDDNARALVAMVKYFEKTSKKTALKFIEIYLKFIDYVQKEQGGFHNYVNHDKQIPADQHIKENLESASTRGLYALAVTASSLSLPLEIRKKASVLFKKNLHIVDLVKANRSIAFALKALCAWHMAGNDDIERIKNLADLLVSNYENSSSSDWKWYEDILAYSNGILPDSLIDAYRETKNEKYLNVARESIDFLIQNSFEGNLCVPIGQNGWLKKGGKKVRHDQQPEEVSALVSVLNAIYQITRDERYASKMRAAFDWYIGNNSLKRVIYDQASGGCYDGLGEKDVNLNEGAESTVMYFLARLELE